MGDVGHPRPPGRVGVLGRRVVARHPGARRNEELAHAVTARRVSKRYADIAPLAHARRPERPAIVAVPEPEQRPDGVSDFGFRWMFGDGVAEGVPFGGGAALAQIAESSDTQAEGDAPAPAALPPAGLPRGRILEESPTSQPVEPARRPTRPPVEHLGPAAPRPVHAHAPTVESPEPLGAAHPDDDPLERPPRKMSLRPIPGALYAHTRSRVRMQRSAAGAAPSPGAGPSGTAQTPTTADDPLARGAEPRAARSQPQTKSARTARKAAPPTPTEDPSAAAGASTPPRAAGAKKTTKSGKATRPPSAAKTGAKAHPAPRKRSQKR